MIYPPAAGSRKLKAEGVNRLQSMDAAWAATIAGHTHTEYSHVGDSCAKAMDLYYLI